MNTIPYANMTMFPITHGHFYRGRINNLLLEALNYPLVTVIAGAGYGKTREVSLFLKNENIITVWLQLSKLDNLTTKFWDDFANAVSFHNTEFASQLFAMKFPHSAALFYNFLKKLVNTVKNINKVVFVFDDFHLINEPLVVDFIENLLRARLENISVFLLGRAKPELELQGFFTGNLLRQIIEKDLCFTREEAAGYLESQDIRLSADSFNGIYLSTEGWISAIYLIGLSFKKNKDVTNYDAIAAAKQQIFELIEQEIFSGYPAEMQRLMIKLSIFDDISIEIIKELSKYNINLLNEIEKTNMFIYFNPVAKTYRFHQLFLEFLSEKQYILSEEEINEAHIKIAHWYHSHGSELDALGHYQKCGNHEAIWNIIQNFEVQIPAEIARLFLEMIESFPKEFTEKYPLTRVQHARCHLNTGELTKSLEEFAQILNQYEPMPLTKESKKILGESYLFMAMISLLLFDYKFEEYYKKADEYLPEGSTLIDNRASFGDGNFRLLIKDPVPGELDRFVGTVMESFPYGTRAMNGAAYGVEYVTQAEAAYCVSDMKRAESCAYQAIYYSRQKDQYDTVCSAYFVLIRIHVNAGNYIKAEECRGELDQLLDQAAKNQEKEKYLKNCVYTWAVLESWYYSRLGRRDKIPDWILEEETKREIYYQIDAFIKAYCLLEDKKYAELMALLESLERYYNHIGLLEAKLHIKIFQSVAAQKTGDISKAITAFKTAYELAYANSLIMPFIELGKHMRAVIPWVKQYGDGIVPEDWLNMVYARASTYAKHLHNIKAQYEEVAGLTKKDSYHLTNREKEVLRYLCQGLTNTEIASTCFITISAVKKFLNNIYIKLNATNRADAVRIAMKMGLDK